MRTQRTHDVTAREIRGAKIFNHSSFGRFDRAIMATEGETVTASSSNVEFVILLDILQYDSEALMPFWCIFCVILERKSRS